MNDWTNLDRHNLPSDILDWKIGETHEIEALGRFDVPFHADNATCTPIDLIHWIEEKNTVRYRRIEPKAPSHEEIMTKWWEFQSGRWRKVEAIDRCDPKYRVYTGWVDADWFINRRSADIPPEA